MPSPSAAAHHKTSTYTPGPYPPHLRFTYCCCFMLLLLCVAAIISPSGTVSGLDPANKDQCPKASSFTHRIAATKEEADLKVLVPNITSLRQFVNCSDPANVSGFCIDVFEMAISILTPPPPATLPPNFSIHYTCFNFSSSPADDSTGPTYDTMVQNVSDGHFDVVVGDVTIGAQRQSMVDFTQKYMESGMVIVTKLEATKDLSPWLLFASPFSTQLWCTIGGVFGCIAILVYFFEKEAHPEFLQGSRIQRFSYFLRFTLQTLVLQERESISNSATHLAMLAWLLFVALLAASYTAALSSTLTVQNLPPSTRDIISLRDGGQKLGFRRGSIVKDILIEKFHVQEKNLVAFRMVSEFDSILTKGQDRGGVVAIVDELPYVNFILSKMLDCNYSIDGPQLTEEGFGFGFNKHRKLEPAFTSALMNLTESGCLQELQYRAGMTEANNCPAESGSSNKVTWRNILPLFCSLVAVYLFLLLLDLLKRCSSPQGLHHSDEHREIELRNFSH